MNREISFETLVEFVEGRLPEAEAERVRTALLEDEALRETVAWLERFFVVSQQVVLATPAPSMRETLQLRFAAQQEEKRPVEPLPA